MLHLLLQKRISYWGKNSKLILKRLNVGQFYSHSEKRGTKKNILWMNTFIVNVLILYWFLLYIKNLRIQPFIKEKSSKNCDIFHIALTKNIYKNIFSKNHVLNPLNLSFDELADPWIPDPSLWECHISVRLLYPEIVNKLKSLLRINVQYYQLSRMFLSRVFAQRKTVSLNTVKNHTYCSFLHTHKTYKTFWTFEGLFSLMMTASSKVTQIFSTTLHINDYAGVTWRVSGQ